ncbi:MAG TPA: ribosome biogenesis GTPase Der [Anaerolineales bacterium]|nr:ribosome biogenesis GTPase Der [Anaerolineales bacterium]
MLKPVVALVGRPNVGKSTLFNRLAGERLAVTDSQPGTTRDRLIAEAEWNGLAFDLVDTGGVDPDGGEGELLGQVRAQAELAVQEADAILFLVDGESGVSPVDHELAKVLRRHQTTENGKPRPPILLVVNKADNRPRREQAVEFFELGMGDPIPISALHGTGCGDLLDQLTATFDQSGAAPTVEAQVKIAIVGRPNVGKSSLLNRLLGEERVIVSPIPGTTRDAIDTALMFQGTPLTLIDTAGIRRRGRVLPGVEKYSVLRAVRAIERADVALLLIDAPEGVTAQDAHIAGIILEKWKSCLLLINKWDAVPAKARSQPAFAEQTRAQLKFLDFVPVRFISALHGTGVADILPLALQVQQERLRRIPTAELIQILESAQQAHAPPSKVGVRLRFFLAAQVQTDPPSFLFHVNDPELVHFSYARHLENRIRERFSFLGTPIRLTFRSQPRD